MLIISLLLVLSLSKGRIRRQVPWCLESVRYVEVSRENIRSERKGDGVSSVR